MVPRLEILSEVAAGRKTLGGCPEIWPGVCDMNIGIYIYDQAEVLVFSWLFEVFSIASRVCPSGNPFTVFLIEDTGRVLTARAG